MPKQYTMIVSKNWKLSKPMKPSIYVYSYVCLMTFAATVVPIYHVLCGIVVEFRWWIGDKTRCNQKYICHNSDVIISAVASQITGVSIVYSIVYSGADQRKQQTPRRWPLCGEFTGDRWFPRANGQQRGKCFYLIMSSWRRRFTWTNTARISVLTTGPPFTNMV